MMMKKLVLAALFSMTHSARAEESLATSPATETSDRQLNGHSFVRSTLVEWAFPNTYFGSATQIGFTKQEQIVPDENGDPVTQSLSAGALAESFDLGLGFTPWLGIQVKLAGLALTGTDIETALGLGAVFNMDATARAVLRILQTDNMQLGLGLGGTYSSGKNLNPLRMILVDQNGISIDRNALLVDLTGWRLGPTALIAFAPMAAIGLQSSFGFEFGSSSVGQSNQASVSTDAKRIVWGSGITLDAESAISVPLAVPVAYQLIAELDGPNETQHNLETGLIYSGRANLDLGVLGTTQLASSAQLYTGMIRMYYHW